MVIDFDAVMAWWAAYWPTLRLPAAIVLAGVLLILLWRKARHSRLSMVVGNIAAPLVLVWEAQGVFELARLMKVPTPMALVLSGVGAAVLITVAARAHEHWKRYGNLGPNGRLLWRIAVPMGVVVALSASSLAEAAARIALPVLAATVVMSRYLPDEPEGQPRQQQRGTWRWTPRRVGVALGLLDPTDADLSQVHAERQIRRLTETAHKLHHGTGKGLLHRMRAARLRRLGLLATPEMVAEVQRRISLVHEIQAATAPTTAVPAVVTTDPDVTTPLAPELTPDTPPGDDSPAGRTTSTAASSRRQDTAARVAKAAARTPTASAAQIAARLGVSERTVQRHLPKSETTPETTAKPVAADDVEAVTA